MPQKDKNIYNEQAAKQFEKFFEIINDGLVTKQDFLKAFENLVDILLKIKQGLDSDTQEMRNNFDAISAELRDKSTKDFENIKNRAAATVTTELYRINKEITAVQEQMQEYYGMREIDLEYFKSILPDLSKFEENLPQFGAQYRDGLELLQGDDRLDVSAIKGLEELFAKAKKDGKPVTISGGRTGIFVYIGGVKKGIIKSLNFAAGAGISIAYSKVNGLDTITFDTSGSGVTVETPPETANGFLTVFTVTARPKWVVSDGTTYYEGAGYSYAALHVTMDQPPVSFIRDII